MYIDLLTNHLYNFLPSISKEPLKSIVSVRRRLSDRYQVKVTPYLDFSAILSSSYSKVGGQSESYMPRYSDKLACMSSSPILCVCIRKR